MDVSEPRFTKQQRSGAKGSSLARLPQCTDCVAVAVVGLRYTTHAFGPVCSSSHHLTCSVHVEGMASTLPNELIAMIADYMVDDGQYVICCHEKLSFKKSLGYEAFAQHTALHTPPTTLALFHPTLLAEFAKSLYRKAIFYFYDSGGIYEYISRPDLSQSAIELRRSMRRIRIFSLRPGTKHKADCPQCTPAAPCGLYCQKRARNLRPSLHLLPKVETVHIDTCGPLSYFSRRGPSRYFFQPNGELCKELVYELWPLIERVQDPRKVFAGGYADFGKLPPWVEGRKVNGFTSPFLQTLAWVRCNNVRLTHYETWLPCDPSGLQFGLRSPEETSAMQPI
ncbi:hypothetical protein IWZ01DRAFT_483496 [Phyllosticta capitalensis]